LERIAASNANGKYRILFADIDGTLVGANGTISARTRLAIRRAREKGCTLVLCTGRSRHGAQKVADDLGRDGFGIVLNGAVVLNWKNGEVVRRSLLPAGLVQRAAEIAGAHALGCIWLGTEERNNRQYALSGQTLWPAYRERNSARIHYVEDYSVLSELPASLAAYGTEAEAMKLAEAWKRDIGEGVSAIAGPTAVYRAWYAQLTRAEATKEGAAAFLSDYLHVSQSQTIAIGDHENDIGLLKWAGIGICMGDGHLGARSAANYITGSISEDGAAAALESLGFN